MAIIKWDPLSTLPAFQDKINTIFEEAFPASAGEGKPAMCDWRPLVDTYEENGEIIIQVELPGVKKEHISIDVKNTIISISGHRSLAENVQNKTYFRRERCHGSFRRAFSLPESTNPEQIDASFKDGLLTIIIHPRKKIQPRKIEIS